MKTCNICGKSGGGVTFSGKGLCKYSAPWTSIHHEFLFDLFFWHIMTKEGKKDNKEVTNVRFCLRYAQVTARWSPGIFPSQLWRRCRGCAGRSCHLPTPIYTSSLPFKEKWFCIFPSTKRCSQQQKNNTSFFSKCVFKKPKKTSADLSWPSVVYSSVKHNDVRVVPCATCRFPRSSQSHLHL